MYFTITTENKQQYIHIELSKDAIEYLLKHKGIDGFDKDNKIRIELEN